LVGALLRPVPRPSRTIAAMTAPPAAGPLAGLLVADCSTVLAGPSCTMLLADLGADVVKVEPPEGDGTRGWGPPWVGEGANRTAACYLAVNRNKRSIRLDLKAGDGRDALRRLLGRADVLVENFRVGGFARLGFDDAELEALNPRLVHLAISRYGPTRPDATAPGYDFIAAGTI
jgi:crotonobetainyl-CoA:carnitine CoA-transferase CaiB-like acyl-CoA transferase